VRVLGGGLGVGCLEKGCCTVNDGLVKSVDSGIRV